MSTVFYYLLKRPDVMTQLQAEVRSSFKSYNEITALSTTDLPFMMAVIREAMRIYPPLALALPRVVPQGGDTVDGHFIPTGVRFAQPKQGHYANSIRRKCQQIHLQRAWTRITLRIRGRFVLSDGLERAGRMCETRRSPSHWERVDASGKSE
jgi:hypothetical protein